MDTNLRKLLLNIMNQLCCALFNYYYLSVGGSVLRVILERLYHCVMSTHLLQTASKRSLKRDANENIGGGAQVLLQAPASFLKVNITF
uniref:Uncharacterized protein n=1 Tax=Cyprinus carpio TaxID=7962 RepID=A0A8C1W3E4_CYPCA